MPTFFDDVQQRIPENNKLTKEGVWLGRLLFYDKMLSGNNTQSCASCHKQEYSFTDGLANAIGSNGDTLNRNTMPIVNLIYHENRFFWNGRANSLEDLIKFPITDPKEMDKDTVLLITELKKHKYYPILFKLAFQDTIIDMEKVSKAISQFTRIIVSKHNNIQNVFLKYGLGGLIKTDQKFKKEDINSTTSKKDIKSSSLSPMSSINIEKYKTENSIRGMLYRFNATCNYCHEGNLLGGLDFANNLVPPNDSFFVVPSLINLRFTEPFMHDGRFKKLEDVLSHYSKNIDSFPNTNPTLLNGLPNLINEYDKKHIAEMFALFEDSSILTNKLYSDPYKSKNFNWLKNPYLIK